MDEVIINKDFIYSQSNNFVESRFIDFTVLELKIVEF